MILSGKKIQQEVEAGRINISPFNPSHIGPNSYDFTLAEGMLQLAGDVDTRKQASYSPVEYEYGAYNLIPGELYLARTAESIGSDYYVPMIDGRSSVGRLGIFIHVTAGFGDVGYHGPWTLEIMVVNYTTLHIGDRIGQAFFHTVDGEVDLYKGRYQGGQEMVSKGWMG